MYTDHGYCRTVFYVKPKTRSSQVGMFLMKSTDRTYLRRSDWSPLSRFLSVKARQEIFSATARFSLAYLPYLHRPPPL